MPLKRKLSHKKTKISLSLFAIGLFILCKARAISLYVGLLEVTHTGPDTHLISLSTPSMNNNHVVFLAESNRGNYGLYENFHQYPKLIANYQTRVPEGFGYITSFTHPSYPTTLPMIVNNRIIFYATGRNSQKGIYSFINQRLRMIINNNQLVPNSKINFTDFSDPTLLNNGNVNFIGISNKQQGIFVTTQRHQTAILMNANQSSIPKGKGKFSQIQQLASSIDMPEYAFIGKGGHNQKGIYLEKNNYLAKIADKNTLIPNGVGFFIDFSQLNLSHNKLAFIGTGILGQQGVYLTTRKGLINVANEKTVIPEGQGTFTTFDKVALYHDLVIFHATGPYNQDGIYLYSQNYGLFKLLSNHDIVNKKKIASISINKNSLDKNYLGLLITFNNNSEGIYIATLAIKPY